MFQSRVITVDQLLAQLADENYHRRLSALSYIRDHNISDRRIVEYLTTLAQSDSDRYVRGKVAEILLDLSAATDVREHEALSESVRPTGQENTGPSFLPVDMEQQEAPRPLSKEPRKQRIKTLLQERIVSSIFGFCMGAAIGFVSWGREYARNPSASVATDVIATGLVFGGVGLVLGPKILAWLASVPW
jgi:hypothetical protein